MYDIVDATIEDFFEVSGDAFEATTSDQDCYDGYHFDKLVFDGKPLVVAGYIVVWNERTQQNELYMCFVVSKDVVKHKRALLMFGKDYVNFFAKQYPLSVIVEQDNSVFKKFAQHFGFEQTNFVEKSVESGIIYNVYIRR